MPLAPIAWRIAALIWAFQIFMMSASVKLTSQDTRSFLAVLWEQWLGGTAPESLIFTLGTIFRKGAHMLEYAILVFLVFRALEGVFSPPERFRRVAWSLGISVAYGLTDEFHQLFVAGRGASLVDWGIDCVGALVSIVLITLSRRSSEARTGEAQ
ncbi:MAG: VanZ family protein [Bryobacteraceae bacterium]